jgi:hypothetical protein
MDFVQIISLNSVNKLIFVIVMTCFSRGVLYILKCYVDELRLQ